MSKSFASQMLEAKRHKQACRNRGQSIGDYRGLAPRTAADIWRGLDDLELAIAALVHRTFVDPIHAFIQDLHWIVLDMNDATIRDMPF